MISMEMQRILECVPDLEILIASKVFLLNEEVIEVLRKSKLRILKFTVFEDLREDQEKLAVQLSKQSQIRCTIFSCKRVISPDAHKFFAKIYNLSDADEI